MKALSEVKRGSPRVFGIDLVGEIEWGTHLCQFYQTKKDLVDILVPYFAEGLRSNEFCMWVTSPPLEVAEARRALRKMVPDLDERIGKGQIEILSYEDWYLSDGRFDSDRVLQGWVDKEKSALERGFEGLRLTGNTFWIERNNWRRFANYEAMVNDVIGLHKMIALCTYSLKKCTGNDVIDVVRNHRGTLIRKGKAWNLVEEVFERKKTEQALRASEQKYRSLFENMIDGFALFKVSFDDAGNPVDSVFLEVNNGFEKLTGLKREEVIGKRAVEVFRGLEKDPAGWIDKFSSVATSGKSIVFEDRLEPLGRWYSGTAYCPEKGYIVAAFHEITDRKRMEEASMKERDMLRGIMENTGTMMAYFDRDFNFLAVNSAYAKGSGRSVEDLIGKNHFALFPNAENQAVFEKVRSAGESVTFFDKPFEFVDHLERGVTYWDWTLAPVKDQVGRVHGLVLSLLETTQRRKAEEEIRSLSRFPAENPNVVMRISKDGNVLYSNQAGSAILDEWKCQIGQSVPSEWHQLVLDALESGTKKEVEEEHNSQVLLMMFSPIVDADYVNVYGRDITERKKAEEALRNNEKQLRVQARTIDEASDAILWTDADFKIIGCNKGAERLYGWKQEDVIGKPTIDVLKPEYKSGEREQVIKELLETGHWQGEVTQHKKDGTPVNLLASVNTFRNEQGKPEGLLVIYRDITERKKAEEELRKARDESEIRVQERTMELSRASEKLQAASLYSRSLIEASLDPLVTINAKGKITDVNKATEEVTGFLREQLIGSDFSDYFTDPEEARKGYRRVFTEGFVRDYPLAIRHRSGEVTDVLYNATVYRNEAGGIQGVFAAARDVTERKKVEQALQKAHDELETRVDERTKELAKASEALREREIDLNRAQAVSKVGSWRLDVQQNRLLWSDETYNMFGIPKGTPLTYEAFLSNVHSEDREHVDQKWQAAIRGEPYDIEHRIIVNGEVRWVREKAELEFDNDNVLLGGFGTVQDITERKEAEEELRETTDYLDSLLNYANAPIIVWDPEFRITRFNHAFEHLSGYKAEEVFDKHLSVLFPEKSTEESLTEIEHTLAGEQWEGVEIPILRKDGNVRTVLWNSANIHAADGKTLMATIAQGQDITERKLLEEKVFQSERKYRSLYETSIDGIVSVDLEGRITECNDSYAHMLGYSKDELKEMTYVQLTPEKWHQIEQDIIREQVTKRGHSDLYEKEYIRKDGSVIPISIRTWLVRDERWAPVGMWAIVRDVTRSKQLENELKRYSEHLEHLVEERTKKLKDAERLATIGETAAMVGHDIRNPLQSIEGSVYLAREEIKSVPSRTEQINTVEEMLNTIHEEATYVDKIVSDLQDYARTLEPQLEEITTQQFIKSTLATLQIPQNVEVTVTVQEDCCTIVADPIMMKRILTNLITNALQSMPDGGKLTIAAFKKQDEVLVNVQDTGQGISAENKAKIFQPLFSTKAKGQGFGLAVVKRLVEAHNGTITFDSEVGKGTTFTLTIPVAKEAN